MSKIKTRIQRLEDDIYQARDEWESGDLAIWEAASTIIDALEAQAWNDHDWTADLPEPLWLEVKYMADEFFDSSG